MRYGFTDRLSFSRGTNEHIDMQTIREMIPGCIHVEKTSTHDDRQGVDYLAHMRRGDVLKIDGKTREKNAEKYWKSGPELALEIWSVAPGGKFNIPEDQARVGWTLNTAKHVDLILYTFNPATCAEAYLLPFPLLRSAFYQNLKAWEQRYPPKGQSSWTNSRQWESVCMFVPVDVVIDSINRASRGRLMLLAETAS